MVKYLTNTIFGIATIGLIVSIISGISAEAISLQSGKYESIPGDEKSVGKIKYNKNTKIEDTFAELQKLNDQGVKISNLTSVFKNGSETVTEFITGDSTKLNINILKSNLNEKRFRFIQNKAKIARESNIDLKQKKDFDLLELMPEFESTKKDFENQDFLITEANIIGTKDNLDKFKQKIKNNVIVQTIEIKSNKLKSDNALTKIGKVLNSPIKASAAFENTLPKSGATYFGQWGDTRWNHNTMRWTANNFGFNDTYEHEVYLWNGNNSDANHTTYLSQDNQTWQSNGITYTACFPLIKSAYSNLPNAYLDTRLNSDWQGLYCDNDWTKTNEVSYTIGTATASDIAANTWYYTQIDTSLGQRNKPVFKTQGQTGYNFPNRVSGNMGQGNVPLGTWTNFGYSGGTTRLIESSTGDFILNPYYSPNGYYVEGFYRQ